MTTQYPSRRDLLRWSAFSALSMSGLAPLASWPLLAQEPKGAGDSPPRDLPPLNRFSRMVQEYFVVRVKEAEDAALKAKAALKTKQDADAYVASVRKKIRESFGPNPERTPLNARITGTVERDTYNIEKVIFESRPGFLVTGNLYLPQGRKFPLPGVVGVCGHSANGKAAEAYQSFAQGLARQGYVIFIFDPIGQGERLQYVDAAFKPRRGIGVSEHLYAGNQQFLVGEFFGMWRAWDGIRALDYLLTREEVDPKHVGITGNSGGGTITTWLCGLEPRWTMAAPACFVTTFRRNLENELPADTEQCPPRAIAWGLDHDDFLASMAPKPVIILAKERDFFDVRGSLEAFARLKRLYTLLGAADNIQLQIGPTEHGYSQENREAMYRFFNRVTKISDAEKEPALTIEKDETLQCTPHGQVAELKSRPVFAFTTDRAMELAKARQSLKGDELKKAVTGVLQLPPAVKEPPEFRILRGLKSRSYPRPHATTYAVESEPGVFALVTRLGNQSLIARPPQDPSPALLYVSHHSADVEMREEPTIKDWLGKSPDQPFYACDLRGVGESRPDTCGSDQFLTPYGSDYFCAIHALMLDKPYLGQKTHDLLRVLDFLRASGHREVHLLAKGWGALPAAFAALLCEHITEVTLLAGLTSYQEIAESEEYSWPLSSLLPGVLARFDLPDVYRELAKVKRKAEWMKMRGAT
jgi:dienelactone hydrolase/pimeloyl-ACP methyl ester carboxylesterase